MNIGDMVDIDGLLREARVLSGQSVLTQEEYEARVEATQRAVRRLPRLRKRRDYLQRTFRKRNGVVLRQIDRAERDLAYWESVLASKRKGRPKETAREIIPKIKARLKELRSEPNLVESKKELARLHREIKELEEFLQSQGIDERRVLFENRPNAPQIVHGWKEARRKMRNTGHDKNCRCPVCKEGRKAERNLAFFGQDSVKIKGGN